MDGSVDFYRNFTEYENGFGNVSGELWLGKSTDIIYSMRNETVFHFLVLNL